jgi:hypothetical protein
MNNIAGARNLYLIFVLMTITNGPLEISTQNIVWRKVIYILTNFICNIIICLQI